MATTFAALVSLMHTLERIQRHTRLLVSVDVQEMDSLREKVSFLIEFSESYSLEECEEAKDLEIRIADAAYAAEDMIESQVMNSITGQSQERVPLNLSCPNLEKVVEDVDLIKNFLMKNKAVGGIEAVQIQNPLAAQSSSFVTSERSMVVGFDDELIHIMERLTGHQSSLQIIPVVGMGGIGKTTLAKYVYENPVIVQHFDILAWVSISQEYSEKQILSGLLSQVKNVNDEFHQMGAEQLGERLYKSLCGMRYLVVLDDMWSAEAWEAVKMFFPHNNSSGSRIIVTTRLSSVAACFDSERIEMKLLDENSGWSLLCQTVFDKVSCPPELKEIGRRIVKNCKGLPLSISVIGGLLARSERTKEYWGYVERDTISIMRLEDDERCTKILSLSYHNLPVHLKPCFLYMGAFPEDRKIRVSWLINLWIAEGFLKPNGSKDLKVVGEEYLNDLIGRNLIFVHLWGSNWKIKFCGIHDLLRDLCLRQNQKENFMYVPGIHSRNTLSSQRRIIVQKSLAKDKYFSQVLETLNPGTVARSLICDFDGVLPLKNFRMLRLLKLNYQHSEPFSLSDDGYLLDDIFQLVNARYIACAVGRTLHTELPTSLFLFWNIQILIVKGTWWDNIAPLEIWEMIELRHLQFDKICLSDPFIQQMNRRGDVTMKNLQTLRLIENFRCSDEVVKRIPNIKKLRILYNNICYKEYQLQNLGLLTKLESLACIWLPGNQLSRTNLLQNLAFPRSLKKLRLSGSKLHWEDMTIIGSLPHLEVLKLTDDSFTGPEWIPVEGEFSCLKFLRIEYCELEHWIAESTHFPRLENLVLRWLYDLVEIPSGIGEIPTLKSMQVSHCSDSAVVSAKKILEEQEDLGNVDLQVQVHLHRLTKLDFLTGKNFQVQRTSCHFHPDKW